MSRPTTKACMCWSGPAILHDGHCCLRGIPDDCVTFEGLPCGHGPEAKTISDARRAAEEVAP